MFELAWPGLALGFLGSLHCVGMCGPIALALPGQQGSRLRVVAGRALYNGGRVITYGILGVAAGLIGEVVNFAEVQQVVSIAAGILILIVVLAPTKLAHKIFPADAVGKLWAKIGRRTGGLFRSQSLGALGLIGLLNGFLPCGLVYVALAGAVATGTLAGGSLFMILFGIGTVPIMIATAMLGPLMGIKLRTMLRRAVPVMATVLALLLIMRGLSLGIPYISPDLSPKHEAGAPPSCH